MAHPPITRTTCQDHGRYYTCEKHEVGLSDMLAPALVIGGLLVFVFFCGTRLSMAHSQEDLQNAGKIPADLTDRPGAAAVMTIFRAMAFKGLALLYLAAGMLVLEPVVKVGQRFAGLVILAFVAWMVWIWETGSLL